MGNLLGGRKICLASSQLSFRLLSFRNVAKYCFRGWFRLIDNTVYHDFDIYLPASKPDVFSFGAWWRWRAGILTNGLNPLFDGFSIVRVYELKHRFAKERSEEHT